MRVFIIYKSKKFGEICQKKYLKVSVFCSIVFFCRCVNKK